jgi:uncharacterized coiled-coil DUF342 family protein
MLTPDELEDWIAKRTAESAESTSLHLWDWQAMCHLKAERDRLTDKADACEKLITVATIAGDLLLSRAKNAEAELAETEARRQESFAFYEDARRQIASLQSWRQEALAQIRTLTERRDEVKVERDCLRDTLADVRKQLADAKQYL